MKLAVKLTQAGNPAAGEMLSGVSAKERVLDYSVGAWGPRCTHLWGLVEGQSYLLCIWYLHSMLHHQVQASWHEASYHFPTDHIQVVPGWADRREVKIAIPALSLRMQTFPPPVEMFNTATMVRENLVSSDWLHLSGQPPPTQPAAAFLRSHESSSHSEMLWDSPLRTGFPHKFQVRETTEPLWLFQTVYELTIVLLF